MYAWKLGVGRDEKKKNYTGAQGNIVGNSVMFMALIVVVVYGCMHMLKLIDIVHLNFLKTLLSFPQYFDILLPSLSSFH